MRYDEQLRTRGEILEELAEAFAAIDNDAIQTILFAEAIKPMAGLPECGVDTIQKLHGIAGPSIVKFVSENRELWNHYGTFAELLRKLKKCNQ
jgi:hypothetical protein